MDLVERLRSRAYEHRHHRKYREEAAQEIDALRAENERLKAAAKALDLDDIEWALNASARQFSEEFTPMRMKIVQRTLMRVRSLRAAMTTPTAPPAR